MAYIPHTLSEDGDPLDVLVVTPFPVQPGSVIRARVIGKLNMEDEAGIDTKLLAVPHDKLTPLYKNVKEYTDLPELLLAQIKHFFENYKALEPGKWVKLTGWEGADAPGRHPQGHRGGQVRRRWSRKGPPCAGFFMPGKWLRGHCPSVGNPVRQWRIVDLFCLIVRHSLPMSPGPFL